MKLDESHELNRLVIAHLKGRGSLQPKAVQPISAPGDHPDPYYEAGSHPDIVGRVWDALGSTLQVDCRALVYHSPALVHPGAGVVFALAYGTRYAIRVPDDSIRAALAAGCSIENTWTGGATTNIEDDSGRGWVFGFWAEEERQWLAETYTGLGANA